MIVTMTGRHCRLLAAVALLTTQSGCGAEGPIDRGALERTASRPESTAPAVTEDGWHAIDIGDVYTVSLNVHCGVRYLMLYGGPAWEATDVDSRFSDLELELVGSVRGELEMTAPDRLEFRHPMLTATFRPSQGAVGSCD